MGTTEETPDRIVGQDQIRGEPGGTGEIAGIALAATSALAFATLAISAKFAYRAGAGVMPLLALRFAVASVLLALFHVVTRRKLGVGGRAILKLLLLGSLGYGVEATLFFAAVARTPAGVVGLIFYSYPLWTTILAIATRVEPFRTRVFVALVLGSGGVALVFSVPHTGLAGPMLALAAAVSVATYFVLMQVVLRDVDPGPTAFWTSIGAFLLTVVAATVVRDPLPGGAIGPGIALGVASAAAFVLLYAAITRVGSARAAIAAMLEPVATLIMAAFLLDEEITLRVAIGAALVVSALPILAVPGRKKPAPADAL